MVDRFEVMMRHSEQVLNRAVDREKSLGLSRRLEATHPAFLLPGVLVRDFSSVVSYCAVRWVTDRKTSRCAAG